MKDDGIVVGASAFLGHITVAKTIAMLVLSLGSFTLGVLPMKLISRKWWRPNAEVRPQHDGQSHHGHTATDSSPVVSLLLCFGGGVLLFTTFLHLQPEVREAVIQLQLSGQLPDGHGAKNLGDLIFCAGFFLVFVIDQIVHTVLDSWYVDSEAGQEVLCRSMSLRRRNPAVTTLALQPPTESPSTPTVNEHHNELGEERYRPLSQKVAQPTRPGVEQKQQVRCGGTDVEKRASWSLKADRPSSQSICGLFAVLALSFHEVFEGLAIGLEGRVDHTWYLFFAVATHKLIIAFCIGLELAWLETKRSVIIAYVATFSVVTPVGIAMGMVLEHCDNGGSVDGTPGRVAVVLQGLAAGTLLYVFFEVLARHKQSGFPNMLSLILGFFVMLVVQMITHNSHRNVADDNPHEHKFHEHGNHNHHHISWARR